MAELHRVVLVVADSTGGIGRHVRTIVDHLVARDVDVVVAAPAATDARFGWTVGGAEHVPLTASLFHPLSITRAVRRLRSLGADATVVHAHGLRAGALAALAGAHPLVVSWHNRRPSRVLRRPVHPLLERLSARKADLTLVVSSDLAERARAAGARDVRVVPVPAPPLPAATKDRQSVRSELGVRGALVVAVARLEAQKRLDVLVDAAAGWADDSNAPVIAVAGTGGLLKRLRRRARRRRAPLVFLGRRDDVADLLGAADVAVLSSDWEGYPLVAQEALGAGVPLVATAVGGVPDLVADAAVLVPPGRPELLRTALAELLGSPERRAHYAAAGRRRAQEWPTLDAAMHELWAIYLDLASRVS